MGIVQEEYSVGGEKFSGTLHARDSGDAIDQDDVKFSAIDSMNIILKVFGVFFLCRGVSTYGATGRA